MVTSKKVKEYAKKLGADLVGVAPMDRFEGAPKQFDPRYIMPESRAMIVMGFRIFRGCFRGIEEGTFFSNYSSMGYGGITWVQQPVVLWNLCKIIEDEGYEAIPIGHLNPWRAIDEKGELKENWSVPVSPDKPAPDVFIHFRIAAFCAGLGEIGYSKIFLTPEFGPRQRLGVVLTDAPLEPDPLYEGPELCDRCMRCVKACTGQAISANETVKVEVAGRVLEWGKLDEDKCSWAFSGGNREVNPFLQKPSTIYEYGKAIEGAPCIRECMIHLEEQGRIKNLFKEPFRRKKPWKLSW
ncbi:MAG: hypothetical protein ACUVXI_20085 [bacterium]